jgi:hypothetical protein
MSSRRVITAWVALCLAAMVALAFLVAPRASSEPDGLERVAIDTEFADQAGAHALGGSPLADYAVGGVDDGSLSTGLSGLVGILLCFGAAAGAVFVLRRNPRLGRDTHQPAQQISRPGQGPGQS